jgi:hypothetical protein
MPVYVEDEFTRLAESRHGQMTPNEWVEVDGSRDPIPVQTETSGWFKGKILPLLGEGAEELLKSGIQYGGRYLRGELDEPEEPPAKRPRAPIPVLDSTEAADRARELMERMRESKVGQEIRQGMAKEANLTAQTSIQMWLNENRVTLVLAAAALLLLYLLRSDKGKGGGDYNLPNFPNLPGPNFGKRRYYYA